MHVFHFKGKYDRSKSKMFLLLHQEADSWFTPKQIWWITGVPYNTARCQCHRLHVMRPPYVRRQIVTHYDRRWEYQLHPYYFKYRIGARGERWLERAKLAGMPVDELFQEMFDWQKVRDGQPT